MMAENYITLKFRCNNPSSTPKCRQVIYVLTRNIIEENEIKFPAKMDCFTISPDRFNCFTDVKRYINSLPPEWVNGQTFVNFYVEFEDKEESMPKYTIRIYKFSDCGGTKIENIEDFLEESIPKYPKTLISKSRNEYLKSIGVYVPFVNQIMSYILEKVNYENGAPFLDLIEHLSNKELNHLS